MTLRKKKKRKRTKMAGSDRFIRSRFRQETLRPTNQSEKAVLSNHPERNSKLHQVPIRLRHLPTTTPLAVFTVLRPPPPVNSGFLLLFSSSCGGYSPSSPPCWPVRSCALRPRGPLHARLSGNNPYESLFLRPIGSPDHPQCDQTRAV